MAHNNSKAAPPPKYLTGTMLVPQYVTQFHCLGNECPDTCCSAWSINVDKDTFQRYRRIEQPELTPLIKQSLTQLDRNSHDKHAKIGLRKEDSHCGLHSKDGMCMVQQHFGEDALSDTCYIYPRSISQFASRLQQSLTLSCPEAARLALTSPDPFAFVSAEFTTRLATTAVVTPLRGFAVDAMDEVNIFVIQLFQTAELSNTEHLVLIGWLCRQLDALVDTGNQEGATHLLTEMRALVESGSVRSIVEQLSKQHGVSITLFFLLFATNTPGGKSPTQLDVLERVRAGLEIDGNLNREKVAENYARGMQLLQAPGSAYTRLISHYLLNDLIRETFPWRQETAIKHYRRFLARYGILRLMLSGMAAAQNHTPDEATMVQVVYVFCRLYQHNITFAQQAENLLAQSNWTELDRLYALLN
jgi:lysine-N-methylase